MIARTIAGMKGQLGMGRFRSIIGGAVFVAISIATASSFASAAVRGPLLSPAERGLASDFVRTRSDVRDLGRLGPNKPVRIGVVMQYRNEKELEQLTILQGRRGSPYYHKYLTLAQWNNYFAPTSATYESTKLKLERAGFRIEQTFANRGMIRATGPARVAERYFRTQFHQVLQAGRGPRYLNVTPAIIPAELRGVAVSVLGLQSVVTKHVPLVANIHSRAKAKFVRPSPRVVAAVTPSPNPASTSTPSAPGPDPTESPDAVLTDFLMYQGYGPSVFAAAYDYPVDHGYGGTGHKDASVIDSDFSDYDSSLEFSTFAIPRTVVASGPAQNVFRVCTDPNDICTICNQETASDSFANCDPEGESTLDAQTIMSLAPKAAFYEYLVNSQNSLDDLDVDGAYERVVSDDLVDAVNSSFGECETDDPSALYAENYVAMEGAAEGITFSASSGDTGATSCGTYAGNGTPQTEINVSEPASAPYFTAVGGTMFQPVLTCSSGDAGADCYTEEEPWMNGGGGVSVYEPQPSWQTTLVGEGTDTTATGRAVPDLSFTADPDPPGTAMAITYDGAAEVVGGTSLSSPMWVAMQTEINQVQASRNGFVNPSLYAIGTAEFEGAPAGGYTFAYRDILLGTNVPLIAGPGYDETSGIGTPLGWELAGVE